MAWLADSLVLTDVANEFVNKCERRLQVFELLHPYSGSVHNISSISLLMILPLQNFSRFALFLS